MAMDEILFEAEEKMDSALNYLKSEFRAIRTGRASAGLVEHIKIDYYGSPTDLRQLASIATPDATQILIKPFDPSSLKDIEKAIYASELGITPNTDGKIIRLAVPPLSGERRARIVMQMKKMAEACRVSIRNARRDGNKDADRQQKDSELTEDEAKKVKNDVQKLTGDYEESVNTSLDAKIKEIEEI